MRCAALRCHASTFLLVMLPTGAGRLLIEPSWIELYRIFLSRFHRNMIETDRNRSKWDRISSKFVEMYRIVSNCIELYRTLSNYVELCQNISTFYRAGDERPAASAVPSKGLRDRSRQGRIERASPRVLGQDLHRDRSRVRS